MKQKDFDDTIRHLMEMKVSIDRMTIEVDVLRKKNDELQKETIGQSSFKREIAALEKENQKLRSTVSSMGQAEISLEVKLKNLTRAFEELKEDSDSYVKKATATSQKYSDLWAEHNRLRDIAGVDNLEPFIIRLKDQNEQLKQQVDSLNCQVRSLTLRGT